APAPPGQLPQDRRRAPVPRRCYSVGDDQLFGVVRQKKGAANTLAALKQIRARRPDGKMIYVILDNLSAHKGDKIRTWCANHAVELCFTPTYSSWANPIWVYRPSVVGLRLAA
ncbi:MAG TPA: transposase, partial [Acidimicrobiales bacterium]|nr:transposase [Acidimicrobiales bacterium]